MSLRWVKTILIVCAMVVGTGTGVATSGSWLEAVITAEFTVVGFGVGLMMIRWRSAPLMRKALAERGQAYEYDLAVRLTPDGIVYDLGEVVMTAEWSCVTDLFRTPKHWVFLAQGSAMVVPRRFLDAPGAERAFIAEVVAHLSEAARMRSPDAVRIAGG